MKKVSFFLLCLLIFCPPSTAYGAIKAGESCPKKGLIKIVASKKFTCIQLGKKFVWNKGVNIAPKKVNPTPVLDHTLSFGLININSITFSPGEMIDISASIKSPAGVKETSITLKNDKYPLVAIATGRLKSGNSADGIWELKLTIPKNIDPQIYFAEVSATNAKNEYITGKKFEISIDPKNGNSTVPNWPNDSKLRNSEGIEITCGSGKKDCPLVTVSSQDVSECKLERPTPNWENPMSFGYSRPNWIKAPFSQAEILVIPFSFSDLRVDDSFVVRLKEEIRVEDKWLETNSYGKFRINWTIAARDSWIDFKGSYANYKSQLGKDSDRSKFVQNLLLEYKKIDLTQYKAILILGGYSDTISGGMEFGGTIFSTPKGNVQGVSFTFGGQSLHLDHNLGHTLFAFEDLYLTQFVQSGNYKDAYPENWDVMGGGANFVGWHRWINGWILDEQVSCLTSQLTKSIFYLTNLDKRDGKPKLISAIKYGIATMAEYRYDQTQSRGGLIIYGLDPNVTYGYGPMTSDDKLLQPGQKGSKNGIAFEVIDADLEGIYVRVSKE